jgi:hypothetical protein
MTKLLLTTAVLALLGSAAHADYTLPAVPKKFQGTWVCNSGPQTIGANTVNFGGPNDKLKLISIVPGDEELNTIVVKWSTPGVIEMVWKLVKLNGKQFLMDINAESSTSASLCSQAQARVVNQAVVNRLCPDPSVRCKIRDNPDLYRREDPEIWKQISK